MLLRSFCFWSSRVRLDVAAIHACTLRMRDSLACASRSRRFAHARVRYDDAIERCTDFAFAQSLWSESVWEMVSLRKLRKMFRRDSMAHMHPRTKDEEVVTIQKMERILREANHNAKSVHVKVSYEIWSIRLIHYNQEVWYNGTPYSCESRSLIQSRSGVEVGNNSQNVILYTLLGNFFFLCMLFRCMYYIFFRNTSQIVPFLLLDLVASGCMVVAVDTSVYITHARWPSARQVLRMRLCVRRNQTLLHTFCLCA